VTTKFWLDRRSTFDGLEDQADRLFRFYEQACVDPNGGYFAMEVTDGRRLNRSETWSDRSNGLLLLARMSSRAVRALLRSPITEYASLPTSSMTDTHGGYVWEWRDAPRAMTTSWPTVTLSFYSLGPRALPRAVHTLRTYGRCRRGPTRAILVGGTRSSWESVHSGLVGARPLQGPDSNMHLVEALSTTAAVTGDLSYAEQGGRIADHIVNEVARSRSWRIHEHYNERWEVDGDYNRNDPDHMYRPSGPSPDMPASGPAYPSAFTFFSRRGRPGCQMSRPSWSTEPLRTRGA